MVTISTRIMTFFGNMAEEDPHKTGLLVSIAVGVILKFAASFESATTLFRSTSFRV